MGRIKIFAQMQTIFSPLPPKTMDLPLFGALFQEKLQTHIESTCSWSFVLGWLCSQWNRVNLCQTHWQMVAFLIAGHIWQTCTLPYIFFMKYLVFDVVNWVHLRKESPCFFFACPPKNQSVVCMMSVCTKSQQKSHTVTVFSYQNFTQVFHPGLLLAFL